MDIIMKMMMWTEEGKYQTRKSQWWFEMNEDQRNLSKWMGKPKTFNTPASIQLKTMPCLKTKTNDFGNEIHLELN